MAALLERLGSTPTADVLSLFAGILSEADARDREDHHVEVVPILVESLEAEMGLIAELSRHYSGLEPVVAESVIGGIADEYSHGQADLIQRSISEDIASIELRRDAAGRWAYRMKDEDAPENPGTQNFLGVLTALIDPEVANRDLAIVAYDETHMDYLFKEAIWDLLTNWIPNEGHLQSKMLVVLVGGGRIEVARHCGRGTGLRFHMSSTGVQARRRWKNTEEDLVRLGRSSDPLVLLLGAGFSVSSGLPLGDELRDAALRRIIPDDGLSVRELIREFYLRQASDDRLVEQEKDLGQAEFARTLTLERVLREESRWVGDGRVARTLEEFEESNAAAVARGASAAVAGLRELAKSLDDLVVVTVNFDTLLESGGDAVFRPVVTRDEFVAFSEEFGTPGAFDGLTPLIKLHGCISSPLTIVADIELTALGLPEEKTTALRKLLVSGRGDNRTPSWIYVGYSMRDLDLAPVFSQREFGSGVDEYWVSPLVDPNVEAFAQRSRIAYWTERRRLEFRERQLNTTADIAVEILVAASS